MAKNSDKRAVVAKRKVELVHAIRNDFPDDQILARAEKLRFAAIKFIKKRLGQESSAAPDGSPRYPGSNRYMDWYRLTERWKSMTVEEVIELANSWPVKPSLRDLGHRSA